MRYHEIILELSKKDVENQIIKNYGQARMDSLSRKYKTTKELYLANIVAGTHSLESFDDKISEIVKSNIDITTIKTIHDLESAYLSIYKTKAENQVNVLFTDNNLKLIKPLTDNSAMYYSQGTNWCTGKSKSWFKLYNLYILLDNNKPIYAFNYRATITVWEPSDKVVPLLSLPKSVCEFILSNILTPVTTDNLPNVIELTNYLNLPIFDYIKHFDDDSLLKQFMLLSVDELLQIKTPLHISDVISYNRAYKIDMLPYIKHFDDEYDDFEKELYNRRRKIS